MKHSNRWLNKTRLEMMTLESRVTPGSLFMSGVEASGVSDVLARPEDSGSAVKKLDDDSIQIVSPTEQAAKETTIELKTAPISTDTPTQQGTTGQLVTQAPHNAARTVIPAMRTSKATTAAVQAAPTRAGQVVDQGRPDVAATPQQIAVAAPTRHKVDGLQVQQGSPFKLEFSDCNTKVFTPSYNTYQGTAGEDEVVDVASGKGGNTGKAYTAANQGTGAASVGLLQRYSAGGACEFSVSITDGAGVLLTGLAINTQGVYVTGHTADEATAFVTRFDGDLSAGSAITAALPADPGDTVKFNGVGLGQSSADPDVHVVGRYIDDAGPGYAYVLEVRVEKDLTTSGQSYTIAADFGGDSEGHGVAADRPNNIYVFGRTQGGAGEGDSPLTYRLNNDGATVPWAFYWTYDGSFNADPVSIGQGRAAFLGGSSTAGGIYFAGTHGYQATIPNVLPGSFHALWVKLNPADGGIADTTKYYAYIVSSGDNGDLASRDLAVDRDGKMYAGSRRSALATPTLHKGRVSKLAGIGGFVIEATQSYGTATDGFDHDVNGVDLSTTSPTGTAMYGGKTNNATGTNTPAFLGCDTTHNGGTYDGFVAASTQ